MTVLDIASFASETVGDISDEMMNFARRAIRLKYQTLYDAHAWRESMRVLEGYPLDPTLNGVLFLPYDCEEVIFLSLSYDGNNYTRLSYRERDWMERFGTRYLTVPGSIPAYYRAENLAWPYLNPGQLTFTSYDPSIFTLFISGLDQNGNLVQETYKVEAVVNPDNTVNPAVVTTANSFSQINVLSKGITAQPLQIGAQFPPLVPPASMPPGMSELMFTQLVLYPAPVLVSQNGLPIQMVYRTQVKLKADTLDSDSSTPRISHITDALIEFTLAALYKKSRQLAKSDSCEQKAIAHIQAAVQIEKNQSEMRQQAVPVFYDSGDYLATGYVRASSSYPWGW
jgi:hypothetical protein